MTDKQINILAVRDDDNVFVQCAQLPGQTWVRSIEENRITKDLIAVECVIAKVLEEIVFAYRLHHECKAKTRRVTITVQLDADDNQAT